jgi:hypothetical protein
VGRQVAREQDQVGGLVHLGEGVCDGLAVGLGYVDVAGGRDAYGPAVRARLGGAGGLERHNEFITHQRRGINLPR